MALQTLDFRIKDISDPGTIVVKYVYDQTSNGFLPPRLTNAQRNAIYPIATGLLIYNSTSNALNIFNGTSWVELGSAGISGTLTTNNIPLATGTTTLGASVINQSSSSIGIGTTTPHASAVLDVVSNTKGVLLPRMVSDPATPANGLMYFNTNDKRLKYYETSAWYKIQDTPGDWSTPETLTITGASSNPVKGPTYNDFIMYRITSSAEKEYEIIGRLIKNDNSSPTNGGGGEYYFRLPTSLQFSSTKHNFVTGTGVAAFAGILNYSMGYASFPDASVDNRLAVVPYDATRFRLLLLGYGNMISSTTFAIGNPSIPLIYYFNFKFYAA